MEVEQDGDAEAFETDEVMRLVPEQRKSNQRNSVIQGLIQTVGAAVCHKGTRLRVTWGEEHLVLFM